MCLGCTGCTHVCGDVCMFVGMDVHMCTYGVYVCVWGVCSVHLCVGVYVCVWGHMYVHIWGYMYECGGVCGGVCMCVYIFFSP
jgi:hypothetical protein